MYAYKEFWRLWKDTTSKTDSRDYWIVWAIHMMIFFIPLPLWIMDYELLYWGIIIGYFILALIPIFTSSIRRLYDNGVSKKNIFWIFLPMIGFVILASKLFYEPNIRPDKHNIHKETVAASSVRTTIGKLTSSGRRI